ncbi:MAG: phage tail sheath family protein, partial [Blastocatellia bacterium]
MPVTPTYPGVYIEEIPSGVRTIIGVATSITAFIGRASRGPVNKAKVINSFGDFETIFGGLWIKSGLGFAVRDFFLNGGSQAVVVRLYQAPQAGQGKASLTVGGLSLEAAYEGEWGRNLRGEVDTNVSEDVATRMGLAKADLFNLTVKEVAPNGQAIRAEVFLNVSVKESPRRIDRVLKDESQLVRWKGNFPAQNNLPAVSKGNDAVTVAEVALANEKKKLDAAKAANPPVPADIAAAEAAVNTAQNDLAMAKTAMGGDDGQELGQGNFLPNNGEKNKEGLFALEQADLFNILCIPPYKSAGGTPNQDVDAALIAAAATYCEKRRAMLLVDPPSAWDTVDEVIGDPVANPPTGIAAVGTNSKNAAFFFPRLTQPNPLRDNKLENFVPCGAVAGVFARTDAQRGVWKAPAGLETTLTGVPQLNVALTDAENGQLNPLGVNCLRIMPAAGRVVWGSRTLQGNDRLASEWKYIPVRRTALFIEETLYRALHFVVFEPNDEPLWAQIRLNVGAFMNTLFRQGAFQGATPREAYFVKCDKETTTQNDIDRGIVNIVVGFAPLKPAEFVIIKLQQ